MHKNPRFLAVPVIYIKEESKSENVYTYEWICKNFKNTSTLQSTYDYIENSYSISPFEWFRSTENEIRKQVYKVGFLRNETSTITMVNHLPIHSLYQSDPLTYMNTFEGFIYSNNQNKYVYAQKPKACRKLTLSSSSSEQSHQVLAHQNLLQKFYSK